jgi:threonine dehydrogenase-like Zn-dependent dehydrogenase
MTDSVQRQPQLTLTAPGRAQWTDAPVPVLSGGDALVRPIAVATCDLDTVVNAGTYPLPLPYALGHEFVAEVLSVADDVTVARPGDRVAVPFQINCGTCVYCARGQTGDCATVPHLSAFGLGTLGGPWGGAVAEVVRVPYADAMLVPLPPGVDPATVVSLDNLPDAWRTVGPYPAGPVLVFGGLSVGLYTVAIARALGHDVTYVDHRPDRLAVAERYGATVRDVAADTRLGPFPLVVHTSGRETRLRQAVRAVDRGGTLVDTGIFPADVAMPLFRMYTTGVTFVTGRVHARRDIPAVLDLIAAGRLDPAPVTATVAGWADAARAWSVHTDKLIIERQ